MKKIEFFKIEGDRINRIRRHCPKCGPAVFLAEHKNRYSCGKCGYTEFKGGGKKEPRQQIETKEEPQPEKNIESDEKTTVEEFNEPEKTIESEEKQEKVEEITPENQIEKTE